ncbi:MAG: hypothetical protein PWQ96_1874 [Clostridia bacterium]|jgi:hypothetical protein|nr:hypothetical protein [Clostridiales bacterium]MDK2986230.1 hypothetical protein [Clostridia bacterium]
MRKPITPMKPRVSQYGVDPKYVTKRMAEYPEMTSVMLKDLFPDTPDVIYPSEKGISAVREAAEKALENVDMSMIKPGDSVNVCASHHGFTLLGGEPYAELLKTVRDVIAERTGTENIRLRAGVGLRFRETEEYIKSFGLDKHYKGKAKGVAPVDEGIPIETEIGTLYGIKAIYDADWIVHVHNSDVREVHFHRQVDRAVKPFGMSYARIETRSTYHQNLGPRGANFTARAIFASDFVQSKFAFTAFLEMSPVGVVSVDADNDLYALNDRLTVSGCKYYGKIMTLMGEIDECIVGLDFPCPVPYVFAAGVIYANFAGANVDLFDLDGSLPPYTWYTEAFYGKDGKPLVDNAPPVNPAIKMVVHNYAWGGYPSAFFSEHAPTIVVGREQADLLNRDPQNLDYMKHAVIADELDTAMKFAYEVSGTDKVIIFDGAVGGVNVSESLGKLLHEKAPAVSEKVDKELLPKWLRQRGIDPETIK